MSTELPIESRVPLFRISVERYHAMRDAGILGEDDHVELLVGLLVPKMTKNPPHRLATGLIRQALESTTPAGYYVDSQEPITTSDSEPEPDVAIIRGSRRDYGHRHPGPADVALVVEVADESLDRDRGVKLELYARAGVEVYWVVNLRGREIEVHTEPEGERYRRRDVYSAGSAVPVVLDARAVGAIFVDDVLP